MSTPSDVSGRSVAMSQPALRTMDVAALIVGTVVGAGIFRTPALVAANSGSEAHMLLAWVVGGLVSLVGALCYAELATAYPHPGGDYHYLTRALGRRFAFLFAWARISVIQTGSIALLAFIFADYATEIAPLGPASSARVCGAVRRRADCAERGRGPAGQGRPEASDRAGGRRSRARRGRRAVRRPRPSASRRLPPPLARPRSAS